MSIEVGSIVEGVVSGITNFGAFVNLPEGKVGLVHISEVADVYVSDVKEFLKEQDKVKVKVLSVDEKGKIGLSIKKAQEKKPEEKDQRTFDKPRFEKRNADFRSQRNDGGSNYSNDFRRNAGSRGNNMNASFEDKLSKFLKDSDERLTDLSRKTDSKRGGRGGGRRR
ncbi:MAG: RNA-binding protein S1 [Anaerovibrio sp.]|uniref:S1 domain-containing RNA-binding protein n=1 Tax=Anaerovibrio sp. TaxID=1872532 RepID=UPI0025F7ED4A|nr:S1 domain-containing RNA-binding protein [Anaerovibrio sp.]MCR5176599.1 RNA-binding protein S1 [Anaerovibrio sp.]